MTDTTNAPIPDGPADREPIGFLPTEEQRAAILAELSAAGVELGAYDRRIVDWMAQMMDWGTAATILGWVRRART